MYYLIFFIISTCIFLNSEKPTRTTLYILVIFFILFAGLRSPYIDNDYQTYLLAGKIGNKIAEPTFGLLYNFSIWLTNDSTMMFLIYSTIGISSQFYVLYKYSDNFWISLVLCFANYILILHMTQIREGAAIGIAMLAWKPWKENKHLKAMTLLVLATLFHYSLGILLILYPLIKNSNKYLVYYLLLIPLGYVIYFAVGISFYTNIVVTNAVISSKINAYSGLTGTNVFNIVLLLRIATIGLLYYYREILSKKCDCFYLLLKLNIVGIFLYVILAEFSNIVANRTAYIFADTELLLLPLLCYIVKPKYACYIFIILYSSFYLITNLEAFKPYKTIFN